MEEQINDIKAYLAIINKDLETIEYNYSGLIDFIILEVIDRICLYLNRESIPDKTERIIANIVNTNLGKAIAMVNNEDGIAKVPEQAISSISDNGQSISFVNEVKRYFTSTSDEEIFAGFASILSRYRRVKVVHTKNNAKSDSN